MTGEKMAEGLAGSKKVNKFNQKARYEQEVFTIKDFLSFADDMLAAAGLEEPLFEARFLLSELTGITSAKILADPEQNLLPEQKKLLFTALARRSQREPAAYIIGRQGFYGRDFIVNKNVLIPRADTEILIEKLLELVRDYFTKSIWTQPLTVLDTFTGSGCIGLSIALELLQEGYELKLSLADISPAALLVDKENAQKFKMLAKTDFFQADIWPQEHKQKWQLITANPPYIAQGMLSELPAEITSYEPKWALDGGDEGLDFYYSILATAAERLTDEGVLALEHGYDQATKIDKIARANNWQILHQLKDYGGHTRVSICIKER